MIHKVAYIGEGLFQVGESEVPYEEASLKQLASSLSGMDDIKTQTWIEEVIQTKQGQLEEKTADTGVIVDLYEVDYPTPSDPLKQTEELASHLDERKDFVTQYVFPATETKDVIVGLRQDLLKQKDHGSEPVKQASRQSWRQVLSWEMQVERDWTPTIVARLKRYALPLWKKLDKTDRNGDTLYDFSMLTDPQWLALMNTILQGIGPGAWSQEEFPQEGQHGCYSIPGIELQLDYDDDKKGYRRANLVFDNEDHTAWVIETRKGSGIYKDLDIGGS
jgi:hypothetical protein